MKTHHYSPIFRILHWAIAITFTLLMLTVFLRLTWLNRGGMTEIIQQFMGESGQTLTERQAGTLARQIRQPMWQWHMILGYVLTGLIAIRFLLPLFGTMKFQSPFGKDLPVKVRFKNWVYVIFYVCITASLGTGLMLEFGPESMEHTMEDIHVLSIYYVIAFLIFHFGGILLAEFGDQKGIISRIIGGGPKAGK